MRRFLAALAVAWFIPMPAVGAVPFSSATDPVDELIEQVDEVTTPIRKEINEAIDNVQDAIDEPEPVRDTVDRVQEDVVESKEAPRRQQEPEPQDEPKKPRPVEQPGKRPVPDRAVNGDGSSALRTGQPSSTFDGRQGETAEPIPTPQVAPPNEPNDTEIDKPLDLGLPFDPWLYGFATVLGTICLITIYYVHFRWKTKRDIKELEDILQIAKER